MLASFLASEPSATLVPIGALRDAPCRPGSLPHTLRFDPLTSQTSGLFVARVAKAADDAAPVAAAASGGMNRAA